MKNLINIAFQISKKGLVLSSLAIILLISNHTFAQVNESGVFIDSNRGQQDERVDFNLARKSGRIDYYELGFGWEW